MTPFVLFDLPETIRNNTDIYIFGHDTQIFRAIYNDDELSKIWTHSLHSWTNDSLLKFHPQKCKLRKMNQSQTTSDLIDIQLPPGVYLHLIRKDIGVIFDEHLTFEQHLNEKKIKNANSIVGIIRRIFG